VSGLAENLCPHLFPLTFVFREQGDKYSNTSMTIIHYLRLFRPDVALIAFFSYLVEAELALEGEMMSMA